MNKIKVKLVKKNLLKKLKKICKILKVATICSKP